MMAPDNSTTEVTVDVSEPETSQHTTDDEPGTTTVTKEATPLSVHTAWFKTITGQLMCCQAVFSFLAFVSIISGSSGPHSYWFFSVVALFSFLWAVCVIIVHLLQLYRRYPEMPWMTIELVMISIFLLLWFVAVMLILSSLEGANSGAAMMCGIFAFLACCISVYLGVMDYLDQIRRQGTPMPSATKAADRAEGGDGGDSDSNSEDSLSEMPTVFSIGP